VIIRDVVAFTPQGRVEGDVSIEDGRIAEVGRVTGAADEVVDGGGRWLWPGAIDAHVHLRAPGLTHKEDWASGSRAAAAGGVTCAFDMPNTRPSTVDAQALTDKLALVDSTSLINYGLFFGANPDNLDECLAARDRVVALKIFMASSTGDLLVHRDEDLDRIFSAYPGRISVHAEDEFRLIARAERFAGATDPAQHSITRDPEAARLGIERACRLANAYARRLHVLHVSTRAEVDAIAAGREAAAASGARITGEACPHHLFMDTSAYEEWGCFVQMNPPLRDASDREATWEALRAGGLDMVATDHAPHLPDEKRLPFGQAPSGVPGIQTVLPMMLDAAHRGLCTHEQVLEWCCHAPARIYQLQGRGRLEPGAHADLVLIDPDLTRTITDAEQHSRCGWTPWRGRSTTGWPVATFVNGVEVFRREGDGPGAILTDETVGAQVDCAP
jgi:dihydroorotase